MTDPERENAIRPEAALAAAEAEARRRYADAVNSRIKEINNQLSLCRKYPEAVYLCQRHEKTPYADDVAAAFQKAGWLVTFRDRDQGNLYLVFDVPKTGPSAGPYR